MQVIPRSAPARGSWHLRDSTTAANSVLVQTVDDPGEYGVPPESRLEMSGRSDLASQRLGNPARLRTHPLRTGAS